MELRLASIRRTTNAHDNIYRVYFHNVSTVSMCPSLLTCAYINDPQHHDLGAVGYLEKSGCQTSLTTIVHCEKILPLFRTVPSMCNVCFVHSPYIHSIKSLHPSPQSVAFTMLPPIHLPNKT